MGNLSFIKFIKEHCTVHVFYILYTLGEAFIGTKRVDPGGVDWTGLVTTAFCRQTPTPETSLFYSNLKFHTYTHTVTTFQSDEN